MKMVILFFFISSLIIRLWGLNAVGNVWDEYFYYDAMRSFVRNLVHKDFNPDHWNANREHPPLGKYVYAPALTWNKVKQVNDRDAYQSSRVISAIIGSLTIALVVLIGVKFLSWRTGIIAGLIYSFLPPVIAYHKIINLDVTMVFLFTLSMYWFMFWVKSPQPRWLWWSVIAACLAIATKFNAVFIALVFYGYVLISQWTSVRKTGAIVMPLALLGLPLVSAGILILVWPWLWSNTLDHFLNSLVPWGGIVSEAFLGHFGPAPIYYFVVHWLVGTPVIILLLFALGSWKLLRVNKPIGWVLMLWFVAPFAISFYHLRQDHVRYILASFPALALIASVGFWWLVSKVPRSKQLATFAVGLLAIYLFQIVWRTHPYYLEYYNELIGGPRGVAAKNLFELGFYGGGIKEATEYINKTAPDGATVQFIVLRDDVPYLDRSRLIRYDYYGADYLVFNVNALRDEKARQAINTTGYEKVYSVTADGAEFVWVYKRQ